MNYRNNSRVFFAAVILSANLSASLHAEEKPVPSEGAPKPGLPQVSLNLPEHLRQSNTTLRIGGEDVSQREEKIERPASLDPVRFELFANDGRLVDFQTGFLENQSLQSIRERRFRAGIFFGTAASDPKPWKKVLLNGTWIEFMPEFSYSFGAFAVRNSFLWQSQSQEYEEGFSAYHTSKQLQLVFAYEMAWFKRSRSYLGKIGFAPVLGVLRAWHDMVLKDDYVEISDHSTNNGWLLGLETKLPIVDNFSSIIRYHVCLQKIKMPNLDFETSTPQHNLLAGIAYGF